MPNWCSNHLVVSGLNSEVEKFANDAKDGDTPLSLNKLFPEPEEIATTKSGGCHIGDKYYTVWREINGEKIPVDPEESEAMRLKYGFDNWYDWNIHNWGTKWDLSNDTDFERGENYARYDFDTAWAPPIEWLKAIAPKYPKLTFRLEYWEGGCNFSGFVEVTDEDVTEAEGDYKAFDFVPQYDEEE